MGSDLQQNRLEGSSSLDCCVSCPHCGKAIEPTAQLYNVTFFGGAADREGLELANVPIILRVVVDEFGNVDALDAPGDEPREGETVHVYKRAEELGWMHFKGASENRFAITADYFPAND